MIVEEELNCPNMSLRKYIISGSEQIRAALTSSRCKLGFFVHSL